MVDRSRLRVGNQVSYYPTAAEVLANGAGPWAATITEVHADGTVDLNVEVPDPTTVGAALASPLTTTADAAVTAVADEVATVVADAVVTAEADVAETDGVADGLVAGDPTTPSTQAAGIGNTTWNVNVSAGYVFVNGVGKYHAAQVDLAVHAGSLLIADGESVIATLYEKEDAGVVTQAILMGTPAATGAETAPTDGDIDTDAGVATWIRLAELTLNRTADTTVTQSADLATMTKWGGAGTALINDLKAKYNLAVAMISDLRTLQIASIDLPNDLKAKYNAAVTLANECKTDINALTIRLNQLVTGSASSSRANVAKGGSGGTYAFVE